MTRDSMPEPTPWNGSDTRDWPSTESPQDELEREQDWTWLEVDCREFKKKYGAGALLRCVSRALE